MRKAGLLIAAVMLLLTLKAIPAAAQENINNNSIKEAQAVQEQFEKDKKEVADIIEEINPTVVAIIGNNTKINEDEQMYSKYPANIQFGSGVIIDKDGRILTNNHVIDGLEDIYVVTYDGNVYKANLLYTDKDIDLALLKINRSGMIAIEFAKDEDLKVGSDVLAIGTPMFFSYRNSATKGIISGLNRPVDGMYMYLQTDASINPGNSGGPLINMEGKLVGINTLGYMFYQGVNFSIPVDNINYFLKHYENYGKIMRCYTGIEFEENWAAMLGIPTNQGLKVVAVKKDSIAYGKIKEGDMLEAIDDKKTSSIAQYNEILKDHLPGDEVKMSVDRGGSKLEFTVILKGMPQ
ncbi:putative serine protease HtrA [Oxobacter pfennigii]|uniref:Putative serine protease HtrA n=1 Tax=Oxobacter pfennigii TaxID=36849 RepID=A0A0P8W1N2_9CLOT|nr:trypsin-like peptidase domain-containing protein [Oxobacter pfennigii]KPU42351.1 putative serine protease HtrA [Oxobacter pfennigii]